MKKRRTGKKKHGTLRFLLLTVYSVLLIRHSEEIAEGVHTALMRCINVIVPSLFAFLAAADMLVRGGAYIHLSLPLRPLSRLMGIPRELGSVFLISNAAGYPSGAAAIKAMHSSGRIDGKSASRLMCFCFNGGPAFFAGAVGTAVFGSARTGITVWLSVLAANILTAGFVCRVFPIEAKSSAVAPSEPGCLLTESVSEAGRALFNICGTILLFSTFLTLIKLGCARIGIDGGILQRLSCFLEISEAAELKGSPARLLPLICAAGAFGGVCVLLQVKAIVGSSFSLLPFLAARTVCAGLAAVISLPFCRTLTGSAEAAAVTLAPAAEPQRAFPALCLVMMIILTLAAVRKDRDDTALAKCTI